MQIKAKKLVFTKGNYSLFIVHQVLLLGTLSIFYLIYLRKITNVLNVQKS